MDPTHERNTALSTLQDAVCRLELSMNSRLIPGEGMSFGFAIRGARDSTGIAAVKGGIQKGAGDRSVTTGPCAFGSDEPVARIIVTVMKHDPVMRCAGILQFSARAAAIFADDLFLDCASIDAGLQNPGISTMDWGIASCCREGVPDVIFRNSARAEGSRIIILGEDPADVANNIIICSNRI